MPIHSSTCTELVIVCGHATFMGSSSDILSEDQWRLQSFQHSDSATGKPGEHATFIAHILSGAFVAAGRPQALLVFSGGNTSSSERTEAKGYEEVYRGLGEPFDLGERYMLEGHATDSYQNLLFSILRFRQTTGRYPEQVTVVTHAFKQERFLDLHASAIRWPGNRIRVQGINPPFTQEELRHTVNGEREHAHKLFVNDPHGSYSTLASKRLRRHFDSKAVESFYAGLEPGVAELLRYSSGESSTPPGRLPWEP